MRKIFKDLIFKQSMASVGLFGTGWGLKIDLDERKKADLLSKFQNERLESGKTREQMLDEQLEVLKKNTDDQIKALNFKEASEEYKTAQNFYEGNKDKPIAKEQLNLSHDKFSKEIDEFLKNDIGSLITDLINKYQEYLLTLTPDKILAIYNIILGGMLFNSFFSVISIMISDNVINRIKFLDKYPRILNLLKLRNYFNKKISFVYLSIHFFLIIFGILTNIWVFFY